LSSPEGCNEGSKRPLKKRIYAGFKPKTVGEEVFNFGILGVEKEK
jgi:hypothetical protein